MTHLLVSPEHDQRRLDHILRDRLGLSLKECARLCAAKRVRVRGHLAKKGDALGTGDHVEIVGEIETFFVPVDDPRVQLVGEGGDYLVVSKPAGMPCHPLVRGEGNTLADVLVARSRSLASASKDPREAGLVHRLDNDTSGLVMIAKNTQAHARFREALLMNTIKRSYFAIVHGSLDDTLVSSPIAHDGAQKMKCDDEGRDAQTEIKVLQRSGELSWVRAELIGGRRHQIRVHLASLGAPLVGDVLYGGLPLIPRHALHACALEIGKARYESALPPLLAALIDPDR